MFKTNLSKIAKRAGMSRSMRKRLQHLSAMPSTRAAAALLPLLAMGVIAARRMTR
ncbi:hypothetical protein [Sphingopyxis fribergensis]